MTSEIAGLIKYFQLEDWWIKEFNDRERQILVESYGEKLIEGHISATSLKFNKFLKHLTAFWKPDQEKEALALKVMEKSKQLRFKK